MYAIIATGGKQYRVQEGDTIKIEKLVAEAGQTIEFDQILAVSDENGMKVGTPTVAGAAVKATVVDHGKNKKVIIFKYKAKKDSRKKRGHRQPYTAVMINSITL